MTTSYYYAGSQRIALRVQTSTQNDVYYLHADHLGSTSLTTCGSTNCNGIPNGNVVAQQRYLPYGAERWHSGTLPTDYRFTGQREEATLGSLYDYGARFYSPYLNRWLQPDSIVPQPGNPQSLNRYAYVRNNPLRYTDPTGHRECEDADCLQIPSEHPSTRKDLVNWYKDRFSGGQAVRQHKEAIVRVEQEWGIPRGYLGAVIRHEGSALHKDIDTIRARFGRSGTTIGLAEMSVDTARRIEEAGYMPASKDYQERVSRLLDPEQNIEYAGAYLKLVYQHINKQAPEGTPEGIKWDLAVVGYNVGEGGLSRAFEKCGFGGLGPKGQKYYFEVVPHISKVAAWLYGE